MKTDEKYRGVRHRILILMYITWLTLSLAPAMVAPPERSFQQGQPEMQQAMDNMVNHEVIMQKRTSSSTKDMSQEVDPVNKFEEVNMKTYDLLTEAEKVLKSLPDIKERQWIESFVERMREIAKVLETTGQHKNMAKESDFVKGDDGLPKQLTQPSTSTVPEINPANMMSKTEMTSPENSRFLPEDDKSEHQTVTKPALSNKVENTESDELVRELENLHKEYTRPALSENLNETQTTSISLPLKNMQSTSDNEDARKEEYEAKLLKEIKEFHRLYGAMPKEVLDILHTDNHKIADSAQNRKINFDEKIKFTEAGMKDRRGMIKFHDLNNDHREISGGKQRNMPSYAAYQLQYRNFNSTFPNKHPNMVQEFPKQPRHYFQNIPSLNQAQSYPGRPQNADQNIQKMNTYNQGKYHDLDMLHQPSDNPDALKQKQLKLHTYYNGRLPPYDYHNYFMRHSYGPYPYMHNWNPRNWTALTPMMSPRLNNQAKIDTQLSDEMKRELRDGKIIVLSNSVVRSNFEQDNNDDKITQTAKPEFQQIDMKNETISEEKN